MRILGVALLLCLSIVSSASACQPSNFVKIVFNSEPSNLPRGVVVLEVSYDPRAPRPRIRDDGAQVDVATVRRIVRGAYIGDNVRLLLPGDDCTIYTHRLGNIAPGSLVEGFIAGRVLPDRSRANTWYFWPFHWTDHNAVQEPPSQAMSGVWPFRYLTYPSWIAVPTAAQISSELAGSPSRWRGRTEILCMIGPTGRLVGCLPVRGWPLQRALAKDTVSALKLARLYQARTVAWDGKRSVGTFVTVFPLGEPAPYWE